ncbi:MAG TPA: hypothetical protein VFT21_00950 [Gemmatimonadaceae bacterium]|nr:hypothetical protein [Gemmatimonadaceae bacterium]
MRANDYGLRTRVTPWPETRMRNLSPQSEDAMAKCDVCGNNYDKSFTVTMAGDTHTFDSFECAIHALAPKCAHCGCKIIGHGVESAGTFYCCASCASMSGVKGLEDRV